jgi:hypothetical protein
MSCGKRGMKWVDGKNGRKSYCRKSNKPRRVSKEACDKRGKKWISSVEGKNGKMRKAYCRSQRKKSTSKK